MALGYTMSLPENDRVLVSRTKFEQDLSAMLGGRVAEQIIFDDVTNGAVDDLDKVTKLARAMVTQYGMSAKMGPMVFGQRHELIFLGREIGEQRNYSEQVAREIDKEVNRIVTEAYDRADDILVRYSDLHRSDRQTADRGRDAGRRGVRGVLRRRARHAAAAGSSRSPHPKPRPVGPRAHPFGADRPAGGPAPGPRPRDADNGRSTGDARPGCPHDSMVAVASSLIRSQCLTAQESQCPSKHLSSPLA